MANWQTRDETGRIIQLGIATAETVILAAPPLTGVAMDWSDTGSGGDLEGWTAATFNLTEDDFEWLFGEGNPITVKAPLSIANAAMIRDDVPGIPTGLRFTSFEIGSKVTALVSNLTDVSGLHDWDSALTRVAMMIEIEGVGFHYMPSCEVHAQGPTGGLKTLSTQVVTVDFFEGDSLAAGHEYFHLQDA